jgi:hypothetical protein
LASVYYVGNAASWTTLTGNIDNISNGNDALVGLGLNPATIYYYSETAPQSAGNYWHYVANTPTVWPAYVP